MHTQLLLLDKMTEIQDFCILYKAIKTGRPTDWDGTGYPGILSIQGLGCSGRPAIWGQPRIILGILGYCGNSQYM